MIRGRVLDERGVAIRGAGIVCSRGKAITTSDVLAAPDTRSDRDGRFALRVRPDVDTFGRTQLLIAAPGRAAVRIDYSTRDHQTRVHELEPILLLPGTTFRGRVRGPGGAPLQGVWIAATDMLRSWPVFASSARSDGDGIFTLPCVPASLVAITFSKPGYAPLHRAPVSHASPLDVTLQRDAVPAERRPAAKPATQPQQHSTVVVRAVAVDTGTPLAHFSAQPVRSPSHPAMLTQRGSAGAVSTRDGVARLHLVDPGAQRWILVTAPRCATKLVALPQPAAERVRLEVSLEPESAIVGRVVDADGVGIQNALVGPLVLPDGHRMTGAPDGATRTDAGGHFRITGLPAGKYAVYVVAPGRPRTGDFTVTVDAGATASVELRLPKAASFRGQIDGGVPPGTRLLVSYTTSRKWGDDERLRFSGQARHQSIPVSRDGRFALANLDDGHYELELLLLQRQRVTGLRQIWLGLVTVTGETELEFTPELRTARIEGAIDLGGHAAHADRLVVFAAPLAKNRDRRSNRIDPLVRGATLDGEGSFRLDVDPGRYRLIVRDMVTGLELFASEPTDASIAGPTRRDLRVAVHEVSVKLPEPEGTEHAPARNMHVTPELERGDPLRRALTHFDSPIQLEPHQRDVTFLAPAGSYRLMVATSERVLADQVFEVRGATQVTVAVDTPPAIEKTDRR